MAARNTSRQDAARALHSGTIHLLRALSEVDRETGLTAARLSALSVLVYGGAQTLGALARAEGVAGPTMTRIVDGLVTAKLVVRQPHPTDGRAVQLAATEPGTALMHSAANRRLQLLVSALGDLPARDQARVLAAASCLDPLASAVRQRARPRAERRSR